MVSSPDDEFAKFLDFGDLDFQSFDGTPQLDGGLRQDGGSAMDTSLEGAAELLGLERGNMQQMPQPDQMSTMNNYQEPFSDVDMEAELFTPSSHTPMPIQPFHHPNMVPPTPQSMDVHGTPIFYHPQMDPQQQLYEQQYRRHQKNQMNFTPLVSPAVTPLDTQFQYPDYAASVDSFSPLTSPALAAQKHSAHHSVYGAVRSDTSDTTSPVDLTPDYMGPTSGSTLGSARKPRRNTTSNSNKNPARAVRQSPAMKPQGRKKQTTSTNIPAREVAGILEQARKNDARGSFSDVEGKLALPYSQDSSGPDSVSPEPLNEVLMPPPATPRSNSAGRSPYLTAKKNVHQSSPAPDLNGEPATPSSLMRIRREQAGKPGTKLSTSKLKEQSIRAEADMEQIMEDIALPEPASVTKRPALKPIDTSQAHQDTTPTLSARKTPGSLSTPVTANGSTLNSPTIGAIASPNGLNPGKRSDPKLKVRDPKKRNSTISAKVSPALRPKISPSIKPLLPEGTTVSSETSALLLASKSNYQNILEGTHFPGVSYPETLSTNLTSKRTSHKLAEQGRRNRINTALQEIASLLPPQTPPSFANGDKEGGGIATGTAAQQSNSKASTVEFAIEYIKSLQQELRQVKGRLEEVEKEKEKQKDTRTCEINGVDEAKPAETAC